MPGVFVAVDYALANIILISRNQKWFFIDSTESCKVMEEILDDFEKKLGKPKAISGLIMTHFHTDHSYGSGAILEYAQSLGQTSIPVYTHEKFTQGKGFFSDS